MFRQLASSASTRFGIRHVSYKKSAVIFAFGVSGTFYYASRTLHADSNEENVPVDQGGNGEHRAPSREANSPQQSITDIIGRYDKLREREARGVIHGDIGISRFDTISVPSQRDLYDAHAVRSVELTTGTSWTFFGLFDGHSGWHTSDCLGDLLIPEVLKNLLRVCSRYEPPSDEHTELGTLGPSQTIEEPLPKAIDNSIKDTFKSLDDIIIHGGVNRVFTSPSKKEARILLSVAQSGSSALLAFFDSDTHMLRVALTGNSRAVLGRPSAGQKQGQKFYDVHVLTADQDAHNPSEEARLTALHPNENIIEKGRVLGYALSRAFGLGIYKWSREIQDRLRNEYLGDCPPKNLKTPPYFTAEPEITTIEVKPGDFLVMASNGLWNCLTSEEAVGLVGLWLNKEMMDKRADDDAQVVRRDELPASLKEDNTVMYRRWHAEKQFLCMDDNAACHLARNALGGADRDLTAALLSMTPPRSLRYRDNISATVVFFDRD